MKINNREYQMIYMNNFFKRFKGLMFNKRKIENIYIFKNCNSIHTFFMKQNIDIGILDKNNIIICLKENLKPFKVLINLQGKTILEMPLNTSKYLQLGQKIKIEN